ncbi:MAG: hypothetical protein AB7Q00_00935 [Phycisphaerales bacterium]
MRAARPTVLVALAAGFALATGSIALAQQTRLVFEASADNGANWSTITDPPPGTVVQVRVRAEFIPGNSGLTTMGLAGLTFQPVVTGYSSSEAVAPLSANGTGVSNESGQFGRLLPFAVAGQGPTSLSGTLTHHVDTGNTLRFAGSRATTMTANLSWGVAIVQNPRFITNPPESYSSTSSPLVFKFGFTLGSGSALHIATTPLESILNARARWYTSAEGAFIDAPITQDAIVPAIIGVPTPGSLGVLALAGLMATRRRSRTTHR